MNELGIMIDISHISDMAAKQAIELSKTPVIASHSAVKAIANHPRNLSDDLIKQIAKKNGAHHVINYSKEDFSKKVLEITNGKGVDAVYDGVGIKTFEGSLECIKLRGTFLSFGNSSGLVTTIDTKKHLAPKAIFFTRPSVLPYTAIREELEHSAKMVFDAILSNKIKIEIFKQYALSDARKAHEDLAKRILTGPAVLIP